MIQWYKVILTSRDHKSLLRAWSTPILRNLLNCRADGHCPCQVNELFMLRWCGFGLTTYRSLLSGWLANDHLIYQFEVFSSQRTSFGQQRPFCWLDKSGEWNENPNTEGRPIHLEFRDQIYSVIKAPILPTNLTKFANSEANHRRNGSAISNQKISWGVVSLRKFYTLKSLIFHLLNIPYPDRRWSRYPTALHCTDECKDRSMKCIALNSTLHQHHRGSSHHWSIDSDVLWQVQLSRSLI